MDSHDLASIFISITRDIMSGAPWPSQWYSYNGGQETAADARHRWRTEAMRDFYAQGVMYDADWNDSDTMWDAIVKRSANLTWFSVLWTRRFWK